MPISSIKELRDQIKAKRPDWDDAKIDEATKAIYMKNPGIVKSEFSFSDPELQKQYEGLKPGQSMMGTSTMPVAQNDQIDRSPSSIPPSSPISPTPIQPQMQDDAKKQAIQKIMYPSLSKQITPDSKNSIDEDKINPFLKGLNSGRDQ
jgi:predicted component of type VI protein secretion system